MPEQYENINIERNDDYDYLRACGIIVKRKNYNSKTVQVVREQLPMAERFLEGRRNHERLTQLRKNKQLRQDEFNPYA